MQNKPEATFKRTKILPYREKKLRPQTSDVEDKQNNSPKDDYDEKEKTESYIKVIVAKYFCLRRIDKLFLIQL